MMRFHHRQRLPRVAIFAFTLFAFSVPCYSTVLDALLTYTRDITGIAGEKVRVKALALADDGFAVLVASAADQSRKPHVLRISNSTAGSAPAAPLRSQHVAAAISVAANGGVIVFEKLNEDQKDKRGAFRTLSDSGAIVTEIPVEGGIAGFTTSGGSIVYLTPEGVLKKAGDLISGPDILLVSDRSEFPHNTILPSSISFISLTSGKIGVVSKASGRLYTADLASGAVQLAMLHAAELDKAKATYGSIVASSKGALPPGTKLATPTPALATAADENGYVYTLVSPYSQETGATIIRSDSQGTYLQSIHIPLSVFTGSSFSPAFIGVRRGVMHPVAPDGKVAVFTLRENKQ